MTLLSKLNSVFEKFSDREAFCIEDKFYTYREFAGKIASIKNLIGAHEQEENIGIMIGNDLETYASIIAVMFCSKTYIPINPAHPADRIENIIQQSGLKIILGKPTSQAFPGTVTIDNSSGTAANGAVTFPVPEFDAKARNAYILFTSGSTGIPKGVPITYHNLNSFVEASMALGYSMNETDRFLQMIDLTFDVSVFSYLVPLCIGACICTVSEKGIKYANVYKVLENQKITFSVMVPSTLNHLRPYFSEISLPGLKHCLFCGEALYKDIVGEWMQCAPNATIENVYGPTEATVFCLAYHITNINDVISENGIVAIGEPIQNMEAMIFDDHKTPLPDGQKGELCLSGNQLTPGYLADDKNKTAFFAWNDKRFYRTGDIAYKGEQGIFMFSGRVDHQVKIQGYRIELSEIDHHLRKIAGGPGAVALVRKGHNGMDQIEAVFEDNDTDVEGVIRELKSKLPAYMIPLRIHIYAPFPLNVNGKTDKSALAKLIPA